MPAEELKRLKSRQDSLESQLFAIDKTVQSLLAGIEKLVGAVSEQSKEFAVFSANYKNQIEDNKRTGERLEKIEEKFTILSNEVIESRPVMKVVSGLSNKLIGFGLGMFVLVGGVIYAALSK